MGVGENSWWGKSARPWMGFTLSRSSLAAALLVWFATFALHLCAAEILSVKVERDDRPFIMFQPFGFDDRAVVNLTVKNADILYNPTGPQFLLSRLAFGLIDAEADWLRHDSIHDPRTCLLDAENVIILATFEEILEIAGPWPAGSTGIFQRSFSVKEGKQYWLAFMSCAQAASPAVSMDVTIGLYSVSEGRRDYLYSGWTQLPKLNFSFFSIFALTAVSWLLVCYRNKRTAHRIHISMALVVSLTAIFFLAMAIERTIVQKTGRPRGWNWACCILGVVTHLTLCTVILMLGSGWSFLKPVLQRRQKIVIGIALSLTLLSDVAYAVMYMSSFASRGLALWPIIYLVGDTLSSISIVLIVWWSIQDLTEASRIESDAAAQGSRKGLLPSQLTQLHVAVHLRGPSLILSSSSSSSLSSSWSDDEVGVNRIRLILFKEFFLVITAYVFFWRLGIFTFQSIFSYRYDWILVLGVYSDLLIFYLLTGWIFRPLDGGAFFRSRDEHQEEEEGNEADLKRPLIIAKGEV